jgi:drug/metabolite transporter (DMT)-like permease
MNERAGVPIAILSSSLGGLAAVATRSIADVADPVTIAAFRFGGGALFLLPLAFVLGCRWPPRRDWPGTVLLGLMFFALFFIVYNLSLAFTTVARATLALSTLPLLTMLVAAMLGAEALTARKTCGVLIAMGGVALALVTGLGSAPDGAWRGDLLMIGGTLAMAFYNVWSRPFIARSSALGFVTASMAAGGAALVLLAVWRGGFGVLPAFGAPQWLAAGYLAAFGGAAAFYLWILALQLTTPTRVASTMAVNPLAASAGAALVLGEPFGLNVLAGIVAVFLGIWIASTQARTAAALNPVWGSGD